MKAETDIVIAGGGMVGITLALQLAAQLPESVTIGLVESFPFPAVSADERPEYHPSFDARSTAISYSTRLIYERMQVWDDLREWLCPIDSIHVSSRGRFGSTIMSAREHGWPALGYVVENAWLGSALVQALYRQGRVDIRSPARVVDAKAENGSVRLRLDGDEVEEIQAALLLVADGANSSLRNALGVAVEEKPYHQHALIANIGTAQPHGGCAFERFTSEGPLALLPLLGASGADHRSALVWTLPPEQSDHLQHCPPHEFLRQLQLRFGYRLGRLLQVGERHSYPLALVQSTEQVRQGVVVMGNAAHSLHPVAGQGYNLALRDIAELSSVLAEGIASGLSPGDLGLLQRYQRRQLPDQARTIGFSDRVPSLFMHSDPVLGLARDMALAGLDIFSPLKREFVRYAAGVAELGGQASA
jgi:2-octaprenyl-6-methoxyphenol hydroxylase